eukprot:scaffold155029_cov43-Cyclotella_meneghiniana.AAC.1
MPQSLVTYRVADGWKMDLGGLSPCAVYQGQSIRSVSGSKGQWFWSCIYYDGRGRHGCRF